MSGNVDLVSDGSRSGLNLALIGVAIGLAVLIVAALVVILLLTTRTGSNESPTPSASPVQTPSAGTTTAQTQTLFFVKAESNGTVWASGVKSTGSEAMGFVAQLRTEDLTCFRGAVNNGTLSGTLVPMPPGSQPAHSFSWTVSGQGENLRLVTVGEISGWREVPEVTVNDYAGLEPGDSWASAFAQCEQATSGFTQ